MKKDFSAIYQIKKCWKEEGRREEKESENKSQSDPAIMPGVMQPGRLSQAQTAQPHNKNLKENKK